MSISGIFARIVAMIGGVMILMRRWGADTDTPAFGEAPIIPVAKPQGIPTLKMPTAKGWIGDHVPTPAPGLKVNAFARDLQHPRWIYVLPNNDILVAEALSEPGGITSAFEYAIQSTMKRAGALGVSANRITLFRDKNGTGVGDERHLFLENQNQPFGMAMLNNIFYVGNTDGIVSFPYVDGATKITGTGKKLVDYKPNGHWTRSLLPSPDGRNFTLELAQKPTSRMTGLRPKKAAPPFMFTILKLGKIRFSPVVCAIPLARLGSQRRANYGPLLTNATVWAMKHPPII